MSNYLDQEEEEVFSDRTDDMNGSDASQAVNEAAAPQAPRRQSAGRPIAPPVVTETVEEAPHEQAPQEEEDNTTIILSDARLRLEQGRLYEMIMNHNMFENMDADARAIKNVEREIKKFAQQRMEIMLGMRQEAPKAEAAFPMDAFPFNSLEVDVLKSLAAAATDGASREAEPFAGLPQPAKRQTLNSISGTPRSKQAAAVAPASPPPVAPQKPLPTKPQAPVKRSQRTPEEIQRILDEEGVTMDEINEIFDPNYKTLDPKKFSEMSTEEVIERNRQANKRVGKQVISQSALPMPPEEQLTAMYAARANQAAAHPQMQMIMGLLDKRKPNT